MTPSAMRVHPAAAIFPMQSEAELTMLADDIKRHGQRHPIVVMDDGNDSTDLLDCLIVDGRNRWRACEMLGIEPSVVEECFADDVDVARYVASVNLHRRHLSPSQLAMLGGRLAEMFTAGAKARQGTRADIRANLPEGSGARARDEAAELVNVSPRTVQSALTLLASGTPELVAAVDAGTIAVSTAVALVGEPAEVQVRVAAEGKTAAVAAAKAAKITKAASTTSPADTTTVAATGEALAMQLATQRKAPALSLVTGVPNADPAPIANDELARYRRLRTEALSMSLLYQELLVDELQKVVNRARRKAGLG
ncbi:MAG: ParB N-terminal domain-containing protein [Polyangiaceae bacterium]